MEKNHNTKELISLIELNKLLSDFMNYFRESNSIPVEIIKLMKSQSMIFSYKTILIEVFFSGFPDNPMMILILSDMKERISILNYEDKNDFKNALLHSISHELRTPLNYCEPTMDVLIEKFCDMVSSLSDSFN